MTDMRRGGKPKLLTRVLRRRIQEKYGNSIPSVDQIAESFREIYPEYSRHKQRLTGMVRRSLDLNSTEGKKRKEADKNDDEETLRRLGGGMCKKAKKQRRRIEVQSCGESESESKSKSKSSFDGSAVAEDDHVYSFEPEFDLTKSILRNKYSNNNNQKEEKKVDLTNIDKKVKRFDGNGRQEGPMFKDFGGMDDVLNYLKKQVVIPLYHPEVPRCVGFRPTTGILLHGPPGSGKTTLARAIANETGFSFYEIAASELVSGISGASEENIRELFSKAYKTRPSIVFIDEIEVITSKRENHQKEMESRIVTQIMACIDESRIVAKTDGNQGRVLVIGATNRPDAVDKALRRPGRFDREIALGIPDENARLEILEILTNDLRILENVDLSKIARATPGFVGADLDGLVNEAGSLAMMRVIDEKELELSKEKTSDWWKKEWSDEDLEKLGVRMSDFEEGAKNVQASSKREGFSRIPDVKWEDVGGLDTLRRELDRYIVRRIKYPDDYKEYGLDLETGFLLYGPPGCGKTLIAKAVANEAGANFIHIKGPELLSKYVGESESDVRKIFIRARTCSPCIVFFDEVDALTTNRGKEGGWVVERLVNQLLVELHGADQREGVYVIGATNRPEMVDEALLRAGRMGKHLYVPLPNEEERGSILKALVGTKRPLDADVDLLAIARSDACANFSGADLFSLVNEAAMAAFEERCNKMESATESSLGGLPHTIKTIHFEQAFRKVRASVSEKQRKYYHRLSKSFSIL